MTNRDQGQAAEARACTFLLNQGLSLLETNYRSRYGEIDLILRDGAVLVFAEVRLRTNPNYGGAGASITANKQAKLIKTASAYLTRFKQPPACRFDAILLGSAEGGTIEWIKNAFELN